MQLVFRTSHIYLTIIAPQTVSVDQSLFQYGASISIVRATVLLMHCSRSFDALARSIMQPRSSDFKPEGAECFTFILTARGTEDVDRKTASIKSSHFRVLAEMCDGGPEPLVSHRFRSR